MVQQAYHRCLGSWAQPHADVPKLLHEEGLDAFEYQASRWGPKPQIKQEDAQRLGEEARKNDVKLSMHGSYFVNLSGKKEVVEASKRRLIACATAADWMGAYVVVFHTGFYGKFEKDYAFKTCLTALKEVSAEMKSLGLKSEAWTRNHGKKIPSRYLRGNPNNQPGSRRHTACHRLGTPPCPAPRHSQKSRGLPRNS